MLLSRGISNLEPSEAGGDSPLAPHRPDTARSTLYWLALATLAPYQPALVTRLSPVGPCVSPLIAQRRFDFYCASSIVIQLSAI